MLLKGLLTSKFLLLHLHQGPQTVENLSDPDSNSAQMKGRLDNKGLQRHSGLNSFQ